jgi:hypothetical protein
MAITPRIKPFQQTFSPARSLADISGFDVTGMEGLPSRIEAPLAAAPLQRQVSRDTGGTAMMPGATNIMLSQAPFAPQQQQQIANPFAGATYNFPVVQPAQAVGATYNITMPSVTPTVAKTTVTTTPSGGGETVRESQIRRRGQYLTAAEGATGAAQEALKQKARTISDKMRVAAGKKPLGKIAKPTTTKKVTKKTAREANIARSKEANVRDALERGYAHSGSHLTGFDEFDEQNVLVMKGAGVDEFVAAGIVRLKKTETRRNEKAPNADLIRKIEERTAVNKRGSRNRFA